MSTLQIEVEVPGDLFIGLNVPHAEFGQRVQQWFILELFREGRISGGKAAASLGMSKSSFIDFLDQLDVPYLDMGPEELERDLAAALHVAQRPVRP